MRSSERHPQGLRRDRAAGMTIPLLFDPHRADRALGGACAAAVAAMIAEGGGEAVSGFERSFAAFVGRRFAVLTASGTAALKIALTVSGAAGAGAMLPNITHPALLRAAHGAGSRPLLADIGDDLNISPADVERRLRRGCRAVVMAHMCANPCDVPRLRRAAARCGAVLIEDASQALGLGIRGKRAGALGDISLFSLSSWKPLSAPFSKAGALLCDDEGLARELRALREDDPPSPATAAMLAPRLAALPRLLSGMAAAQAAYRAALAGCRDVEIKARTPLAQELPLYAARRDALEAHLRGRGVFLEKTYPALSVMEGAGLRGYPASGRYLGRAIHLPLFPLLTPREAVAAARAVVAFYGA